MVFGIVVDRFLLESPLADAPQVNGNTLLISKLGTEIVALALHFSFDYAKQHCKYASGTSEHWLSAL